MTDKIREATREKERETEDEMARRKLRPRACRVRRPATMTPQREKKLPKAGPFDGHTAESVNRVVGVVRLELMMLF